MTYANAMKSNTNVWESIQNSIFYAMIKKNSQEASKFCVPLKVAKLNCGEYHKMSHGFVHCTQYYEYKRTIENGNMLVQYFMDTNDKYVYDAMLYSMWNLEFQWDSRNKQLIFTDLQLSLSDERCNHIFKLASKDYMDYCVENDLI